VLGRRKKSVKEEDNIFVGEMSLIVGIDLGTSGAVVSTIKKGSLDVILNEASKRKSPGLVSFHNGQRYLGEPASSLEASNAKNTVRELKRFVGKNWSDPEVQRDIAHLANKDRFKELPNDQVGVEVTHDGQTLLFDVRQVLAMQLGGLKRTSEKSLKEVQGTTAIIRDVVLSVPPFFTDQQRRALLDAAKIAGLNVLRLVNEQTAVALDYGMWKNARNVFDEKAQNVMFVDVGFAGTWVSCVSYTKGKLSVLSCASDRELGGRDVDSALMEQFAAEFQAKNKSMDPRKDVKAMLKLRSAAEKAKQVLTPEGMNKAEVYVEYLMNETDLRSMLTIEQLDAIVKPLAERITPLVERALQDAGLKAADLSAVEIVGGSSRMRQFKKALGTVLGLDTSKAPNFGVLTTLNADESVGRGCALMCAMLSPQFRIATSLDVKELVPLPIKVNWEQPASGGASAAASEKEEGDDAVAQGNTLGLLKRTDDTPKLRRVTFRRNEPFEIIASYDEPLEEFLLPTKAPRIIGKFKVSGMPTGKDLAPSSKIAVTFTHDKSGVFGVSAAQLQVEETVKGASDDAAKEGEGKDAAPKKKIVKTDLQVHSVTASCSEEELERMTRIENELTTKDKALRDLADKRNELEEFIYSARSDIDEKLKQFATEDEAKKLKVKLDEEENWLYENSDTATLQQLSSKLAALHTPYDAIQNRLLEIDARTASTERLSNQVQSYLAVANSVSPDHAHITDDERKKVRSACDDIMNWLHAQQEAQAKLPLNKDPTLTASAIDERSSKLRQDCRAIVEKPKPKPASAPTKTATPDASKPADAQDAKPAAQGENGMDVDGEEGKPADGEDAKKESKAEDKVDVEELD
jgi:heat shock protein 4